MAMRSAVRQAARRCTLRAAQPSLRASVTMLRPATFAPASSIGKRWLSAVPVEEPAKSFCFQCEQTENGTGCAAHTGVCGKTPVVSAMQDLFIYQLQGISQYAHEARKLNGTKDSSIDLFILEGMFSTLTNVNFDATAFERYLAQGEGVRAAAKAMYEKACMATNTKPKALQGPAQLNLQPILGQRDQLEAKGLSVGVTHRKAISPNVDVFGLGELVLYGLKGMFAYAAHARALGVENEEIGSFAAEAMATLVDAKDMSIDEMLALALKVGEVNYTTMQALDQGHVDSFGVPTPCDVQTSAVQGKCILVSGHDIHDLLMICEKTAGKGINIYTHGEMLPGNTYPELKKHKHLIGNWGGPWQLQKMEFTRFPGAIIMTSNCMVEPQKRYKDRIFTRRFVGWEGVPHIGDNWEGFDKVIEAALEAPGFPKTEPHTSVPAGYNHRSVIGMADTILDAIKSGDVKRFFVIGGCDGSEGERSYFRDLATHVPDDSIVVTMGCGKYRFNRNKFAPTKGGVPRLLDVGQCNDAFGAIQIALALSNALKCGVNDLPISYGISWFEQKAVAVLLTMLHLNVQNIYLGPKLPAFATPNMLNILVEKYGIRPINWDNYDADLKQMCAGK